MVDQNSQVHFYIMIQFNEQYPHTGTVCVFVCVRRTVCLRYCVSVCGFGCDAVSSIKNPIHLSVLIFASVPLSECLYVSTCVCTLWIYILSGTRFVGSQLLMILLELLFLC